MKKLAIAAILVAALAVVTSGAALWRTRNLSNSQPKESLVDVPDGTNKSTPEAALALTAIQLKYKVIKQPSDTIPEKTVISQSPAAGTKVPAGTVVELTVSSGPP